MTPRQRKDKSLAWLPPRVYLNASGAFAHYPSTGGSKVIAKRGSRPDQVWASYNRITQEDRPSSLAWMWREYQGGDRWQDISDATRTDYCQCSKKPLATFAEVDCTTLRQPQIRKYLDLRGKTSKVRANRELNWMTVVFGWAFERGLMPLNPCHDVKPFRERRRTHYAEDADYAALYALAPPAIRVAMEISYCTGLRQADVLSLTWGQVLADGVLVKQQKNSVELDKELSERLKAALSLAKTLSGSSIYVVHAQSGTRYTRSGFNANWRRWMQKIPSDQRFTFHDIRRKAITDAGGDKKFSGHKTDAMAARYNVKPIRSPSH